MRLLKGYKPKNVKFVEYHYEVIPLRPRWYGKKLEAWMPYDDYSKDNKVRIGEVVRYEAT